MATTVRSMLTCVQTGLVAYRDITTVSGEYEPNQRLALFS